MPEVKFNEAQFQAERKQWRDEHGITSPRRPTLAELTAWRAEKGKAFYAEMYQAWLDLHPGEPLPEHLCALGNPLPGQEQWCAEASAFVAEWERRLVAHLK